MMTVIFVGSAFALVVAGLLYLGRDRTREWQTREARVLVARTEPFVATRSFDRAA